MGFLGVNVWSRNFRGFVGSPRVFDFCPNSIIPAT